MCERCGLPASVHITNEEGQAVTCRHLCLQCAADEDVVIPTRERALNRAVVLIAFGLAVLLLSLLADPLSFGRCEGFGWKQFTGVGIGAVLTVVGAMLQIRVLFLLGLMMAALAVLADWLGFGSAEGFGSHQITGTVLGALLVAFGLCLTFRHERNEVR